MSSLYVNSPTSNETPKSDEQIEVGQPEEIQEQSSRPQGKKFSGFKVLALVLSNILVWGLAYAYLKGATPVYRSSWGVIVLGEQDSQADVILPDAGKASTSSGGSRTKSFDDARADYVYIAESSEVLKKAATIARVEEADFGQPEITADEASAIISFKQTAKSPELAHRKSLALYSALNEYLEELRQSSLYQKKSQNNKLLQDAREKVKMAQSRLAEYQETSSFESDAQLDDLATGLESLRRLRADFAAQAVGLDRKLGELSRSNRFNSQDASDAHKLKGDQVYQQTMAEYSRLRSEFSGLSAELSPQHPQVIESREALGNTENDLEQRGSILLGRSVNIETLTRLEALITDPQVNVVYEDLFKESTLNRSDRERLESQSDSLKLEINQMEVRLNKLAQEKLVVDRLKRELQVAEAILASKLAKLDLDEENIYSVYPPLKLVVEPTIPSEDEYISPNTRMVLLTALAASFLITVGILLFWQSERSNISRIPEEKIL